MLFWVAMSNVTSAPFAGAERLTVKVAVTVPLLPSTTVTSLIVRFGATPALQLLAGEFVLRGLGAKTKKSAALLSVSVQSLRSYYSAQALVLSPLRSN